MKPIDAYHRRFGHDPASVHMDHIYRTRGIVSTVTGKGFASRGRPRIINQANAEQVKQDQQQGRDDATARMAVEGKCGQGKRRCGLGRLMAKLAVTSDALIQVSFLVMNVEHLLARGVCSWLSSLVPKLAGPWEGQAGGQAGHDEGGCQ